MSLNINDIDILIVGAGASGLMAALELSKAGKKVVILEARDRIGGRILPLNEKDFEYAAQGGAEWIHGKAPITKALVKQAGLTLIPESGEIWSTRNGKLSLYKSFIQSNESLKEKLESLKQDISIADFLEQNFKHPQDSDFKNSILKQVQGYDAADPNLMSTFALREEWLSKTSMTEIVDDNRIKEGYGALISFLEEECIKNKVEIKLNTRVMAVEVGAISSIRASGDQIFKASKVIITVPIPVLKDIEFNPELTWKKETALKIGFGNAIKVLIKFKTMWWEKIQGKDLSKLAFLTCNEKFLAWWTQYPEINTTLTGWMAGPEAAKYKQAATEEILDLALTSISNALKINKEEIVKEILFSKVINWPADPFTKGAYSYTTYQTGDAYEKLAQPYNDILFFAGEALYTGDGTATVEGALGSGKEVAAKIISISK